MGHTTIEILAAEGRDVKIAGETVHVRELPWTDALIVLEKLSGFAAQFIKGDQLVLTDMLALVVRSKELTSEIVTRATEKDADWLGKQSPRAVLAVLDVAIELNFSEQLKELGKALGRRFGFGAAAKTTTPNSET